MLVAHLRPSMSLINWSSGTLRGGQVDSIRSAFFAEAGIQKNTELIKSHIIVFCALIMIFIDKKENRWQFLFMQIQMHVLYIIAETNNFFLFWSTQSWFDTCWQEYFGHRRLKLETILVQKKLWKVRKVCQFLWECRELPWCCIASHPAGPKLELCARIQLPQTRIDWD